MNATLSVIKRQNWVKVERNKALSRPADCLQEFKCHRVYHIDFDDDDDEDDDDDNDY